MITGWQADDNRWAEKISEDLEKTSAWRKSATGFVKKYKNTSQKDICCKRLERETHT